VLFGAAVATAYFGVEASRYYDGRAEALPKVVANSDSIRSFENKADLVRAGTVLAYGAMVASGAATLIHRRREIRAEDNFAIRL